MKRFLAAFGYLAMAMVAWTSALLGVPIVRYRVFGAIVGALLFWSAYSLMLRAGRPSGGGGAP